MWWKAILVSVAVVLLGLLIAGAFAGNGEYYVSDCPIRDSASRPYGHVYDVRLERRLGADRIVFRSADKDEAFGVYFLLKDGGK